MATDYTSRDFESVKDDLLRRARATIPEWSRAGSSDFAMMLVDLWSYIADIQNYYVDKAHNEAFLSTATQVGPVHALARILGYNPNQRVSSSATVRLYNSSAAIITIPKDTQFVVPATSSTSTVYFASTGAVDVAASTTSGAGIAVAVREGRYVSEDITTNYQGGTGGTFMLSEKKVIPDSLSLLVGTTTYQYASRLTDIASDTPAFTTVTDSADNTVVVLGNGVNGLVPPSGSSIKATYRVGKGSLGNVVANAITALDSPVTYISIKSSTAGIGGNDPESITSIKANAPTLRRAQDRAVTLSDYTSLIQGFSGVTKAYAISSVASGAATVNYTALPNYPDFESRDSSTALSLTADFGTAGTDINSNLPTYLSDRSMLGVAVNEISTTINFSNVYVDFSSVVVQDGYYQTEVKNNITSAIQALFTWDAVEFNQIVKRSLIESAANSVTGVTSVTLSNLGSSGGGSSLGDYTITATTSSQVYLPVIRTITYAGVTGGVS
jgi:hypothetical protein